VEPGTCGGCGADLAGTPGRIASSVQVLDIPPAALMVTEYQMMRRECGCGQVTAAPPPPGVTGGPVCYGPGVADAATLLASTDVIVCRPETRSCCWPAHFACAAGAVMVG